MTESCAIRAMRDDDLEQVIALWHAAGIARPWNDPAKDIAFARRGAHATVLVGELAGRIVATVMVGEDGHRGWAYYVATDPAHRGRGFGRAIMQAAEDWLASRGVWKVQLLIREDNRGVKDFYECLGYRDNPVVCLQKVIAQAHA